MKIVNRLPSISAVSNQFIFESFPEEMKGSEILQIGTDESSKELSLVIEYKTKEALIKKIVLEFNEVGMWINKTKIHE